MNSFKNHIDPAKEEQLQWQKIEVDNQAKRIVKLTKTINHGNKEANLRKKAELITLVQDFNQRYESIHSLYEDLKEEVKREFKPENNDDHGGPSPKKEGLELEFSDNINPNKDSKNSDIVPSILKDKLTDSSEEVEKEIVVVKERNFPNQEMEAQIFDLKNEIEALCSDKRRLENEASKMSEKISRLEAEESERAAMDDRLRKELETKLREKCNEIEDLKRKEFEIELSEKCNEIEDLKTKLKDFEEEMARARKSELSLQDELKRKTSQLEKYMADREIEASSLQKKIESLIQSSDAKIKTLEKALENEKEHIRALEKDKANLDKERHESSQAKSRLEQKNAELTDKIADQQKTLIDLGNAMAKLEKENEQAQMVISSASKSDFKFAEKKIEETAEEYRKQFEDKYRILSRRIRVAEQLHAENKEWYRASKEAYEQGVKNIRDLSVSNSDMLAALDATVMKFEECGANFMNRVSKASCDLKFAREWARRKNEAARQARGELEGTTAALDEKEAEILGFRERMWRCENRVRELERMVKEGDDAMMGLKEEKREAIRQLCVWIDYHRSRSDYYVKVLRDNNVVGRSKNKKTN